MPLARETLDKWIRVSRWNFGENAVKLKHVSNSTNCYHLQIPGQEHRKRPLITPRITLRDLSIPRQVRNLQRWYSQIPTNLIIKATWQITVLRAFINVAICNIKLEQTISYLSHSRSKLYNLDTRVAFERDNRWLYHIFKITATNNEKNISKINIEFGCSHWGYINLYIIFIGYFRSLLKLSAPLFHIISIK